MSEIISFFVTLNGVPQIGLTPLPAITIYDAVTNSIVLTDVTTEIGGGFYKYVMPPLSTSIDYLIKVDAGSTFPPGERYYFGEIENLNVLAANTIWNFSTANSLASDSFGAAINNIDNVTSYSKNVVDILLKYQANKTKIDPNQSTLTVYDDDGSTPIKVFKLYNNNGILDINTVFERRPQ